MNINTEATERAVTGGKMRWTNVRNVEQVDHLRIVWGDKCKAHEAGWCLQVVGERKSRKRQCGAQSNLRACWRGIEQQTKDQP